MADFKSLANMQIGGPKYPKKRRINLYQKQTKKGKIAAELGAFAVFMVFVYGFSRFGVMLPLQEADRAEAVYAATEKELRTLEKSNEVYGEVLAEYAHYGNGYLNEEESKLPDRRMIRSPRIRCHWKEPFPMVHSFRSWSVMRRRIRMRAM